VTGVGRVLVLAGLVLVALGFLLGALPRGATSWIGRLPGDFRIERGGFRLYLPVATSLVVSLLATGLLRLFGRR
jgi:hypothetical protein